MLESTLEYLRKVVNENHVAFHGVCNGLNNILAWSKIDSNFGLFDNDETKIGRKFFGKIVKLPDKNIINEYDCIVVVPFQYFKEIKNQYRELGFKGKIIKTIEE